MKALAKGEESHYATFDNLPALASAKGDPVGFIRTIPKPVILDEVQRVPELFLAILKNGWLSRPKFFLSTLSFFFNCLS
jgi:hypothetical protein